VGIGVANTFRHNAVRDCHLRIGREVQLPVGREPPLPVQVLDLSTRRPDLVVRDWDNGRDLFIEVGFCCEVEGLWVWYCEHL
jgi:hypothetical protein